MQNILGILVNALHGVVTNLVSHFLAPEAEKYKKWVWVVFAALIGFLVVLASPFSNKEAKHDKNLGIPAGRDVNTPGGVLHTGQGNVYVTNPTTPIVVSDKPEVSIHQTTGGQNSPAVVTGGDVTITTETKDQKEEKKK